MTTWREEILKCLQKHNEKWDDIIYRTLTEEELDDCQSPFAFTIWTNNRVYFMCVYDGVEWVESVARNPCSEKMRVGGE